MAELSNSVERAEGMHNVYAQGALELTDMEMLTLTTFANAVEVFLGAKYQDSPGETKFQPPVESPVVVYVVGLPNLNVRKCGHTTERKASIHTLYMNVSQPRTTLTIPGTLWCPIVRLRQCCSY